MLLSEFAFDRIIFKLPHYDIAETAMAALNKRFPNIPTHSLNRKQIIEMLGCHDEFDFFTLRFMLDKETQRNLRDINLVDFSDISSHTQSAMGHLAVITKIMDKFDVACSETVNTWPVQEGRAADLSVLQLLYRRDWLQSMTATLFTISKNADACATLDTTGLRRAVALFASEMEGILSHSEIENIISDYYWARDGEFNDEITDPRSELEFHYYGFIFNLKCIATEKRLGTHLVNASLITKELFSDLANKATSKITTHLPLTVKKGKMFDVFSEMHGFKHGFQQVKPALFNTRNAILVDDSVINSFASTAAVFAEARLKAQISNEKLSISFTIVTDIIQEFSRDIEAHHLKDGPSKSSVDVIFPSFHIETITEYRGHLSTVLCEYDMRQQIGCEYLTTAIEYAVIFYVKLQHLLTGDNRK
jgi:hypothetical protein